MALSLGIVGLPNVGKSTLFSLLTRKAVEVSNYPFTTIDPNVGVVAVPDVRLGKLAALSHSARIIPATMNFVDIAGLVRGANRGEGLGNQFLAQIREVDAIAEVTRAFPDEAIVHVEGKPDPLRDHEIIETELVLKDLETVEKRCISAEKEAKVGGKDAEETLRAVMTLREILRHGEAVRMHGGENESRDAELLKREAHALSLLTAKPLLVVVNTGAGGSETGAGFRRRGIPALDIDLKEEQGAQDLNTTEREELGLGASGLDRLIQEAFSLLGLSTFFTTGADETRAWIVPSGAPLPQAAGVIHSDFERHFIRGEVIFWKDLISAGGWADGRAQGLLRNEGKDYVVRDGDVLEIKHGA